MAGTVTPTSSAVAAAGPSGAVTKFELDWTCDASGNVSGDAVTLPAGTIVLVEFVPGTGGSAPTDLYDVDFLDANGTSMFDNGSGASIGANLSATLASHKVPFITGSTTTYVRTWLHGGTYQLTVANAGISKSGTVNIYMVAGVV